MLDLAPGPHRPQSTNDAAIPPWALGPRIALVGTATSLIDLRARLAGISTIPRPAASITLTADPTPAIEQLTDLDRDDPISTVILSVPRTLNASLNALRSVLAQRGMRHRLVPVMEDLLLEEPPPTGAASHLPPRFDLAALIDRRPYGIDRTAVARLLTGRRILVTGAGGSIGSEIVRVVAAFNPSLLVLMERSENALFEIDRQLQRAFPGVARRSILHDVVDAEATLRRLVDLRPEVVFHAAAHKHVPLMEDHPALAVENNLFGTRSIADAAVAVGASRFVLVSSDKAVNPTSVMGATKRLAEMYIQGLHAGLRTGRAAGTTRMAMVRFGNVLGSAGSVVPIWTAQLAEGGPITVTDDRMTRYFMTIHEAATLVIQAAALIDPAEPVAPVFVLDMGQPIRVLDMARRFVRLHGFEPRVVAAAPDPEAAPTPTGKGMPMDIVTTGARPGEKLYEELAYGREQLRPTPHPGINAWIGAGASLDPGAVTAMIADLSGVRTSTDSAAVVAAIHRHVPEMQDPQVRVRPQGPDSGVPATA